MITKSTELAQCCWTEGSVSAEKRGCTGHVGSLNCSEFIWKRRAADLHGEPCEEGS